MTDPRDRDPLAEARRLEALSDYLWWDALLAWLAIGVALVGVVVGAAT